MSLHPTTLYIEPTIVCQPGVGVGFEIIFTTSKSPICFTDVDESWAFACYSSPCSRAVRARAHEASVSLLSNLITAQIYYHCTAALGLVYSMSVL